MVSSTVQDAGNLGNVGGRNSMSDEVVRYFAQAVVSINLEHIFNLIFDQRCRAISAAIDAADNKSENYIHSSLLFCARCKNMNLDGFATPFHDPHTGEHIYSTIKIRFLYWVTCGIIR